MKNICLGMGLCLFFLTSCHLGHHYRVYQFDNGDDYEQEGLVRIVDPKTQKMGYATPDGDVVIKPRFAFAHPFRNGVAKVTNEGYQAEVHGSHGEYHIWQSKNWFYIDKQGDEIKK